MFSFRALKAPRYLEMPASPRRSVIVAGVGRSGTTWLGDVVSQTIKARVVFEPCLTGQDGRFLLECSSGKVNLGHKYERPLPLWNRAEFEREKDIIERLLFGCIKDEWIDQDVVAGIFSKRVIKLIRANLFIGHIAQSWPEAKILYVIRSPHKVVESMMNQEKNGWKFDWRSTDILDFLESNADFKDLAARSDWDQNSLLDRLTLRWCIEMKMALDQLQAVDNKLFVQYESLAQGNDAWITLASFLRDRGCHGVPARHLISQVSRTSSENARVVRLTTAQIARVQQMADVFGLSRWIV